MTQQQRSFVNGYNYYVPGMQAGAQLGQLLDNRVFFGAPKLAAANANDVASGIAANGGTTASVANASMADAPFGRNVVVKASGATGGNLTVTVVGRDYLGQPMRENIVVANADGTNNIAGIKAFKYVDRIINSGTATNAVTFAVGFGARLGLPYNTIAVEREYVDGVVGTAGTLVAGVRTDPQTATTGDPRGTYTPTATLDGVKVIAIDAQFTAHMNSNDRGGLHGIPHFAG